MNYEIGRYYRYPEPSNKRRFKLKEVDRWVYRFECGHCVTDSVFMDMIDCTTGIQVYEDLQIKLF